MKTLSIITFFICSMQLHAWSPVKDSMLTKWGEKVSPENAWTEYPRPQMVRSQWTNLNGLWDVAVTKNTATKPTKWKEKILVPYALETPLSGIGRRLESDEVIWYRKAFNVSKVENKRHLLNFEGVDYKCQVWLNGKQAGSHIGGNLPFHFDVTPLIKTGENIVELRVIDGTDDPDLYQLRGKQKRKGKGIWYSPSSGIWATVWLEAVPMTYIESLKVLADRTGELKVDASIGGTQKNARVNISVLKNGKLVTKQDGICNSVIAHVKNPELWSPADPNLYDFKVELVNSQGTVIDSVESYTGFRTIGRVCDANGNWQFTLNGKPIFHLGPLDQGWWPDSFLNPPADEAIVWEMNFLKKAGFNMIRKHKKAEPRRYYYHADRIGFLVWQDQTSGGSGGIEWPKWKKLKALCDDYKTKNKNWWKNENDPVNADWPDWAHKQYMDELKTMMDVLHNHPSIVVWTTFNERWGQHSSMEVGNWAKAYDAARHLNIASGGNFFKVGDIADEHNYPNPDFPLEIPLYDDYIKVVGEFGGHGWAVKGHLWDTKKKNWGYGGLPKTIEEYIERYVTSSNILGKLKKKGVAAGVYTQTTDVEGEINGLITYDRKIIKIPAEKLYKIHKDAGLLESER